MNGLFSVLTEDDLKRIAFVLLVILANFVFAVLGAIVRGGFDAKAGGLDYKKLPVFFTTQVLPFVVGLAFFEAFLHVLPPSELTQTLLSPPSVAPDSLIEGAAAPVNWWLWLDPATLWAVYGAMVAKLVTGLLKNMAYLVGKGQEAAQNASKGGAPAAPSA